MPRRSVRRHGDGIRVDLPREELEVLRSLGAEMAALLASDPPDEVRERLFPPAYDDAVKEAEYRRLTASDLDERKAADLATLRASLERRPPIDLTSEEAGAWLGALQDMRLTLGAMLGIEDDGWEGEDDDPQFAVLHYLGFLQDSLVGVLM